MCYTGSGFIHIYGDGDYNKLIPISYKWGEGSILYVKYRAEQGVIERIAIKKLLLNNVQDNYAVPIYKDTFNRLWNEDDLILEDEARQIAVTYLEKVLAVIL